MGGRAMQACMYSSLAVDKKEELPICLWSFDARRALL